MRSKSLKTILTRRQLSCEVIAKSTETGHDAIITLNATVGSQICPKISAGTSSTTKKQFNFDNQLKKTEPVVSEAEENLAFKGERC